MNMESRKKVLMNLFAGQQWRHEHREQTCGHSGGSTEWDELREERETYTLPYVKQVASENWLCKRSSTQVL